MPSSNKTGLVLKISLVLFILLATVAYKLNVYFKNEKLYSDEVRMRNKVVLLKTAVSGQLSQLRNTLSGYENRLDESDINWVQLDPFFAIASIVDENHVLKVNQILVRSNTPAERWNAIYLEKALAVNQAVDKEKNNSTVLAQLFLDKTGMKFLILRFKTGLGKELAVIGSADYFQKFFDLERGEKGTALLATTEDVLVAHSEGDYIATQTSETRISKKKYLYEKEEIIGTNLIAMNYILKNKIVAGFAVPWSIAGVVVGFGCILIAVLFYSLDPIDRKVERYKLQERAQIYKETVGNLTDKAERFKTDNFKIDNNKADLPPVQILEQDPASVTDKKTSPPKDFYIINQNEKEVKVFKAGPVFSLTPDLTTTSTFNAEVTKTMFTEVDSKNVIDDEKTTKLNSGLNSGLNSEKDQFLTLDSAQIDLTDIEKALALDDFDSENITGDEITIAGKAGNEASAELLKHNLTSQKVSISPAGSVIDKPQFTLQRKDYKVDEFKVNIRRPENIQRSKL